MCHDEKSIHEWLIFSCFPLFNSSPQPVCALTPALGQGLPVNRILLSLFSSLTPSAKWSTKIRVETPASARADWIVPVVSAGAGFHLFTQKQVLPESWLFPLELWWLLGERERGKGEGRTVIDKEVDKKKIKSHTVVKCTLTIVILVVYNKIWKMRHTKKRRQDKN